MTPVEVTSGQGPVVLGIPHTGTWLPPEIEACLNARGKTLSDTDWNIHKLYDGVLQDVTVVRATFHRYVVDANRDPSGDSLYPGQNTTGLVPLTDFDGQPIWDTPPDASEVEARRLKFHAPYHAALAAEMERVRNLHGVAVLYDCHSIRSEIPFLFEGILPDFNIGTNNGTTCASEVEAATLEHCTASGRSTVLNGRFKGGWTTRHYGQPDKGWHAIQMELAQSTHLTEEAPPWALDEGKCARLRPVLSTILHDLARLAPSLKGKV